MKKIVNLWLLSCILTLVACGQKAEKQQEVKEDTAAKKMLQGIWLNDDDEDDVAFRVKGDTIYYPDSTSQPVYFYIAGDTLVMKGANIAKYPIVKQAEHIFQFKVQNGDPLFYCFYSNFLASKDIVNHSIEFIPMFIYSFNNHSFF